MVVALKQEKVVEAGVRRRDEMPESSWGGTPRGRMEMLRQLRVDEAWFEPCRGDETRERVAQRVTGYLGLLNREFAGVRKYRVRRAGEGVWLYWDAVEAGS